MACFGSLVRSWSLSLVVTGGSAVTLLGCGGPVTCTTGTSQACTCTDGRPGAQICRSDGTYDACICAGGMTDAFAAQPDAWAAALPDAFVFGPDGEPLMDGPAPARDGGAPACELGVSCECGGGELGYCEAGREGPVCDCDPGPVPCAQDVDWLFLVDTSSSMAEEQVALATEIPRLVRILATGDADDDGSEDFTPVRSMHFGVVTPDLGTGPHRGVPTCREGFGEDGILRRASRGVGCPTTPYPTAVFEFAPSSGGSIDDFAGDVACIAQAGTGGCGFEQQLEASLRALSPAAPAAWTRPGFVPPTFRDGSSGHGTGVNADFLRTDSVLALTLVTDEDDCSVPDTSLFVTTDPRYMDVPLNLRCGAFLESLYPTSRYVDGLMGLRPHPGLLVYSAITGVPTETFASYDAILAHPDMVFRPNPTRTNPLPVCTSATGSASPARRIVEVARDLDRAGVQTSVSSICASSFESAVSDVVRALAAARDSC